MSKRQKANKPIRNGLLHFKERKNRWSLTLIFSLIVFLILLSAIALAAVAVYVLVFVGVLDDMDGELNRVQVILLMSGVSLFLGSVIVFFGSRIPLKPLNRLINQINRLAAGDFKVRLSFGNVLENHPEFKELSTGFNKMAEELEHTEMLRSDFINNFSHEFKTPIVSIAGFAKLLQKENLSEEQKMQYLRSIEEESVRLADMATNVLNLTRIENRTILTEVSSYNLSEQIRSAVLLLEEKWSRKDLDLCLEFGEYMISANEELMKQVWINLLDNAVKFVPDGGRVGVEIRKENRTIEVTVSNTGSYIPPDKMDKVFNKFYQGDESHASKGNGVGLAMVKKIVALHHGEVWVESEVGLTSFTVRLPALEPTVDGE